MNTQQLLDAFKKGDISQDDFIKQIQALPQNAGQRGRPKKTKVHKKRNGRPRLLSAYKKDIAMMTAVIGLDELGLPPTNRNKILSEHFATSTKTIERVKTLLNKRIKAGEVSICRETKTIIFSKQEQIKRACLADLCNLEPPDHWGIVKLAGFPKKPPKIK